MNNTELQKQYAAIESVLGFNIGQTFQGDDNWFKMKLGVISSSNFHKILSKPTTDTYKSYLLELAGEVATGEVKEQAFSRSLNWGHAHEPIAREQYAFIEGVQVVEYPFIYKDKRMRVGRSPDGIVIDNDGNFLKEIEIKAPYNSMYHVDLLANRKIKTDYIHQMQAGMWVNNLDKCDFISFDNRFKENSIAILTIERDEEMMRIYDDAVNEAIYRLDALLGKIGLTFGAQWNQQAYKELQI